MHFVTNRISTRKAKSFDDIIKEIRGKDEEIKTASIETVVKVAEKDEADSSGQLDVEPLHQKGESTTMPKNGPNGKKEGTEKGTAKSSTDPEADGKDSGQPKAEGSEKFTNDPEVEEEAKGGSSREETKEAGIKGTCEKCNKPKFLCKCDGDKEEDNDEGKEEKKDEDKEASNKRQFVKIANLNEKDMVKAMIYLADQSVKSIGKEASKQYLKSLFGENKFANLNSKNKEFLKAYWTKIFDEKYADDMIADK